MSHVTLPYLRLSRAVLSVALAYRIQIDLTQQKTEKKEINHNIIIICVFELIMQRIKGATHMFWKLSDPWGELLVQRSMKDVQNWQDAGNFTVSPKS